MSQRIARIIPRTLRAARVCALKSRMPRCLPYNHNSTNLFNSRLYSSLKSDIRGTPIKEEVAQEQLMTPAEKERIALHNQALDKMAAMKQDEAIALMDSLLSRTDLDQPERRCMLYNLGVFYHAKGDQDNAAKYWKDSLAITLTEDEVLRDKDAVDCAAATAMNLGSHYFIKKEYEKATAYLEAAEALDPEDGEILFNLGVALAHLGRHEESTRRFEKAAERGIEKASEILKLHKRGEPKNPDGASDLEGKGS